MKQALILFLLVLPVFVIAQGDSTQTCSTCCCQEDATPAGVMISHVHEKNEFMFSYRFMTMGMEGMQAGQSKMANEKIFEKYLMSSNNMRMDMHMLMAMYGITSKLTVMAMANYNVTSMDMAMLPGSEATHVMNGEVMGNEPMDMRMTASGFGDTKIQFLLSLLNSENHHLLVAGGISLPTGSIHCKGKGSHSMYPDQRLPYSMQMGSGTWDLLPAINYLFQKDRLTASTQVTSVIRTGYNAVGYKLGDEYVSNTWLAFRWYKSFATSLRGEVKSVDHIYGRDKSLYAFNEPSARPLNYGGQWVTGFLGVSYAFDQGILSGNKLGIEYGVPLYQHLNGPQMPLSYLLNASWSYIL